MVSNKYKIYRNKKKNAKLSQLCDSAAAIWNHTVLLHKRYYKIYKKTVPQKRMRQQIAKLRTKNHYWKKLNSQPVQEIVDRVYEAYDRFFKKISKRPPKIKKWRKFKSFVFSQSGFKIEDNRLIINKVGTFKFSKSREYYDVRNVRIKRDSVGDWWIIITSSIKIKNYKKTRKGAFVGFDFSLPKFLIGSDGTEYNSPLFYHQHQDKISKIQRSLSKKRKGSKNKTKKHKELSLIYRKLADKRRNHHWELANKLCSNYEFIALETLNVEVMKKLWGKKVSDLSFSSFIQILKHVATNYGTTVLQIDKWYPSSKTCYECGEINRELKLSDREWNCQSCGIHHDRDKNASKNILRQGIVEYKSKYKTKDPFAIYDDGSESHSL